MIQKDLYYSPEKVINPSYFDGRVKIREIFNDNNSSDQEVYFVEFSDGSLTTVHYHQSEQLLIPLYGNGIIGEFTLNPSTNLTQLNWQNPLLKPLKTGEIVLIRPNVLHFHGALPGQNFSHVAIRKLHTTGTDESLNRLEKSQTVWAYDIIAQILKSDEKKTVDEKLNLVSKKVRELVSKWNTGYK